VSYIKTLVYLQIGVIVTTDIRNQMDEFQDTLSLSVVVPLFCANLYLGSSFSLNYDKPNLTRQRKRHKDEPCY